MRIQEYACPQENVLIDTHEGYVLSSDRKNQKNAKLRNLLIYY